MIYLGALPKPQLYAVLRGAEAAVLPSLVDNLPNTVIESLMLGLPVIGSAGASIDELIEPGITGELVPLGDVPALAAALVRFWRGQSPVRKGFLWRSPIAREMEPPNSVESLLQLAESARSRAAEASDGAPRPRLLRSQLPILNGTGVEAPLDKMHRFCFTKHLFALL